MKLVYFIVFFLIEVPVSCNLILLICNLQTMQIIGTVITLMDSKANFHAVEFENQTPYRLLGLKFNVHIFLRGEYSN